MFAKLSLEHDSATHRDTVCLGTKGVVQLSRKTLAVRFRKGLTALGFKGVADSSVCVLSVICST